MLKPFRKAIRKLKGKSTVVTHDCYPADFGPETIELIELVKPFTMTSPERIFALQEAVEFIVDQRIPGDIVECGVWKGGSMMAVASTLIKKGDTSRDLHLYDTFEGMSEPTEMDLDHAGNAAVVEYNMQQTNPDGWCYSPLDEVEANLVGTGYDRDKMHFIKGKVEETIPHHLPKQIALLRLDTDWYESTKHELDHLYPRLSPGGILIIDDYGHWSGARQAVDEYFMEHGIRVLLHRVDYTARMCHKPAA